MEEFTAHKPKPGNLAIESGINLASLRPALPCHGHSWASSASESQTEWSVVSHKHPSAPSLKGLHTPLPFSVYFLCAQKPNQSQGTDHHRKPRLWRLPCGLSSTKKVMADGVHTPFLGSAWPMLMTEPAPAKPSYSPKWILLQNHNTVQEMVLPPMMINH